MGFVQNNIAIIFMNKSHPRPPQLAARTDNILKASYFMEVTQPFAGSKSLLEKQIENEMVSRIKVKT